MKKCELCQTPVEVKGTLTKSYKPVPFDIEWPEYLLESKRNNYDPKFIKGYNRAIRSCREAVEAELKKRGLL